MGQSSPNHPVPLVKQTLQRNVVRRCHSYSKVGILVKSQFSEGQVALKDRYLENTMS